MLPPDPHTHKNGSIKLPINSLDHYYSLINNDSTKTKVDDSQSASLRLFDVDLMLHDAYKELGPNRTPFIKPSSITEGSGRGSLYRALRHVIWKHRGLMRILMQQPPPTRTSGKLCKPTTLNYLLALFFTGKLQINIPFVVPQLNNDSLRFGTSDPAEQEDLLWNSLFTNGFDCLDSQSNAQPQIMPPTSNKTSLGVVSNATIKAEWRKLMKRKMTTREKEGLNLLKTFRTNACGRFSWLCSRLSKVGRHIDFETITRRLYEDDQASKAVYWILRALMSPKDHYILRNISTGDGRMLCRSLFGCRPQVSESNEIPTNWLVPYGLSRRNERWGNRKIHEELCWNHVRGTCKEGNACARRHTGRAGRDPHFKRTRTPPDRHSPNHGKKTQRKELHDRNEKRTHSSPLMKLNSHLQNSYLKMTLGDGKFTYPGGPPLSDQDQARLDVTPRKVMYEARLPDDREPPRRYVLWLHKKGFRLPPCIGNSAQTYALLRLLPPSTTPTYLECLRLPLLQLLPPGVTSSRSVTSRSYCLPPYILCRMKDYESKIMECDQSLPCGLQVAYGVATEKDLKTQGNEPGPPGDHLSPPRLCYGIWSSWGSDGASELLTPDPYCNEAAPESADSYDSSQYRIMGRFNLLYSLGSAMTMKNQLPLNRLSNDCKWCGKPFHTNQYSSLDAEGNRFHDSLNPRERTCAFYHTAFNCNFDKAYGGTCRDPMINTKKTSIIQLRTRNETKLGPQFESKHSESLLVPRPDTNHKGSNDMASSKLQQDDVTTESKEASQMEWPHQVLPCLECGNYVNINCLKDALKFMRKDWSPSQDDLYNISAFCKIKPGQYKLLMEKWPNDNPNLEVKNVREEVVHGMWSAQVDRSSVPCDLDFNGATSMLELCSRIDMEIDRRIADDPMIKKDELTLRSLRKIKMYSGLLAQMSHRLHYNPTMAEVLLFEGTTPQLCGHRRNDCPLKMDTRPLIDDYKVDAMTTGQPPVDKSPVTRRIGNDHMIRMERNPRKRSREFKSLPDTKYIRRARSIPHPVRRYLTMLGSSCPFYEDKPYEHFWTKHHIDQTRPDKAKMMCFNCGIKMDQEASQIGLTGSFRGDRLAMEPIKEHLIQAKPGRDRLFDRDLASEEEGSTTEEQESSDDHYDKHAKFPYIDFSPVKPKRSSKIRTAAVTIEEQPFARLTLEDEAFFRKRWPPDPKPTFQAEDKEKGTDYTNAS